MLLVFGIAVAAALAVAAHGWLSERDPESAERTARSVRQLVAVVAVLARAVDGVLEALQPAATQRPHPSRPLPPLQWDDPEDEADELEP